MQNLTTKHEHRLTFHLNVSRLTFCCAVGTVVPHTDRRRPAGVSLAPVTDASFLPRSPMFFVQIKELFSEVEGSSERRVSHTAYCELLFFLVFVARQATQLFAGSTATQVTLAGLRAHQGSRPRCSATTSCSSCPWPGPLGR